jgi:hypothetical protein
VSVLPGFYVGGAYGHSRFPRARTVRSLAARRRHNTARSSLLSSRCCASHLSINHIPPPPVLRKAWLNLRRGHITYSVLLFFSGIPTAEKPQARRAYLGGDAGAREEYRAYLDETSILIPLPPALYRPLPKVVKRTILLDFPFYQFDESEAVGDTTPAS